jgi:hypothetical protein
MREQHWSACVVCWLFSVSWLVAAPPANQEVPFWLMPNAEINLQSLTPAPIVLLAAPDARRGYALLQTGPDAPVINFVPSNPALLPFVPAQDSGYQVVAKGLKVGATPYGDRKYKIEKLPEVFSGLTLVQTRAGSKAVLDGRYAIVLSGEKPSLAFLAVDERALDTYKQHGAPAWLQEFAPTGHKLATDDPIMKEAGAQYAIFVRKTASGRIVLGPPCLDIATNAMYFAFFAAMQEDKPEKEAK